MLSASDNANRAFQELRDLLEDMESIPDVDMEIEGQTVHARSRQLSREGIRCLDQGTLKDEELLLIPTNSTAEEVRRDLAQKRNDYDRGTIP